MLSLFKSFNLHVLSSINGDGLKININSAFISIGMPRIGRNEVDKRVESRETRGF